MCLRYAALLCSSSLLFLILSSGCVNAVCNMDKNYDKSKDPCEDIRLDVKRKYKTSDNKLELHVRFCQICEYNCDVSKSEFDGSNWDNRKLIRILRTVR